MSKSNSRGSDKTTISRDETTVIGGEQASPAREQSRIVEHDPSEPTKSYRSATVIQGRDVTSNYTQGGWVDVGSVIKERFVLHEMLGKGGMGAVFRAIDRRRQEAGDNEPFIAIKVLGESFRQHKHAFVSLQREAKKTSQLAHPNIVTVYDFDRDGDLIYLTMEELRGKSLKEALDDQTVAAMSFKQKLDLIRQIAMGLDYAHSKGIVHSDLKPANIFLTEELRIKVLDFGIARAASGKSDDDKFDAGILGALTPAYASLEMFAGEDPHPSDDVYALGIVACEILAQEHPYQRLDALQAHDKKLKTKVPPLKNTFMKRVLKSAVAFKRHHRIPDAGTFLKKLNRAIHTPKILAGATTVAILAIGANYWFIQNIEVEAVPFESLPQEQQIAFNQLITDARQALLFVDIEGTMFYLDRAYQIHTTHEDLIELRSQVYSLLLEAVENAPSSELKVLAEERLNSLLAHEAFTGFETI